MRNKKDNSRKHILEFILRNYSICDYGDYGVNIIFIEMFDVFEPIEIIDIVKFLSIKDPKSAKSIIKNFCSCLIAKYRDINKWKSFMLYYKKRIGSHNTYLGLPISNDLLYLKILFGRSIRKTVNNTPTKNIDFDLIRIIVTEFANHKIPPLLEIHRNKMIEMIKRWQLYISVWNYDSIIHFKYALKIFEINKIMNFGYLNNTI